MRTRIKERELEVWRRSAVPVLAAAAALMFLFVASSASGSQADVRLLPSSALLGTWRTQGDGIVKVVIKRDRPGRVKLAVTALVRQRSVAGER